MIKICNMCNQPKELDLFQKDKRRESGHTNICKTCAAKLANNWHKANRSHHNEKMKAWRNLDKIKNPAHYLWQIAKRRAKEDGRIFTIKPSDVIVPTYCPIFGVKLEFVKGKYSPNAPSIDAIIPALGYVPSNIAVISHRANSIKNNASVDDLEKVIGWLEKTLTTQ